MEFSYDGSLDARANRAEYLRSLLIGGFDAVLRFVRSSTLFHKRTYV